MDRRKGTNEMQMKEIGESLRQKRTERNLSLKDAENAISIRANYLLALEEGDVSKLISPVYAQGFFRQYAAYLGIDGEQLVRDHPELFARSETQDFAYGIGTLEVRGQPGGGIKWFPNFLWILVFALISGLCWYLAKFFAVL